MKRSWLISVREFFARRSSKPWACFETAGPDSTGQLPFSISWNAAFTANLQKLGMAGQTDEETVQLFFLQLRMAPESMLDQGPTDDAINPASTPNLTSEANKFVRG